MLPAAAVLDSRQTHAQLPRTQGGLGAANVDVEIVAYGPGIGMLKMDSPVGGLNEREPDTSPSQLAVAGLGEP